MSRADDFVATGDEIELMTVVREWLDHWMLKEPGYCDRAIGVDANMRHDLVRRLLAAQQATAERASE